MMYWKALLMGDDEVALKIADSTIPAEAQALGRQVSKGLRHRSLDCYSRKSIDTFLQPFFAQ